MTQCGFIFDCDGTLMDTIGAWHDVETKILGEAGITLTKEERDELNTLMLDEAGIYFHEKFGVMDSPEQVSKAIFDYMVEFYHTQASLNLGVRAFIEDIAEAGFPLAVLSSSPEAFLHAGIERVELTDFFKEVISVEELTTTKRDPETFLELCEKLDVSPAHTWFFDDSWYALKTAQEAGLRTVGVFSKDECGTHEELGRYSERVIDSFEEFSLADFIQDRDNSFETKA